MPRIFQLAILFFTSLFMLACSPGNSQINMVKNGTMVGYEKTTIGKAFEASFDKPKWEYLETDKGVGIVQFTGAISAQLHNDVAAELVKLHQDNSNDKWAINTYFNGRDARLKEILPNADAFFESLRQEFNCTVPDSLVYESLHYPCHDEKSWFAYTNKVIDKLLDVSWQTGDPVTIQWAIHANGQTFELHALESNSWIGIKADSIIQGIYK